MQGVYKKKTETKATWGMPTQYGGASGSLTAHNTLTVFTYVLARVFPFASFASF